MRSCNIGINKQSIFKFIINYYGISSDPSLGKVFPIFLINKCAEGDGDSFI